MSKLTSALSIVSLGAIAACGPATPAPVEAKKPVEATPTTVDQDDVKSDLGAIEKTPELVFPDEAFRREQPTAGPPRAFQLPPVKTFKLGNQIDVYLVERHELPTISVDLSFEGGSMNDPDAKIGQASVCMSLVGEGTKALDKLEFQAALADTASRVSTYAGQETQGVTMRTLSKHFDSTFSLFRDTLASPGFRQSDFERIIKSRLDSLKQARASARPVARRVASRILYGPGHSFGKVTSEKSYQALTVGDCVKYHASYIKPRGARLYIVGDMTQEQVVNWFGALLAEWTGTPKRSARLPRPRTMAGKIFFVDIPDSAQSEIRVLHFGPRRTDKGFLATTLAASTLGGSFSRLDMNLREDKGYSYGARARYSYTRSYGRLLAFAGVRANSTRQSVLEFFNEMRGLQSGSAPATESELAREKEGAILSLPGRFATSQAALGRYRNLVYHGLPLDYYNTYVDAVAAVTLEQVNEAAKKHIKPDTAVILVVGDGSSQQTLRNAEGKDIPLIDDRGQPVTLRAALEGLARSGELGRGKLVELSPDGDVVKGK